MAIAQLSLSKRSPSGSSSQNHGRKPLETSKKITRKRASSGTLQTAPKKVKTDHKSKKSLSESKGTMVISHHQSTPVKLSAIKRANQVEESLPAKYPSFVKPMLPSHVAGGFWLSFPKRFCDSHLPMHDAKVILVGEGGQEYETKYLIDKNGLSGGWRGFSMTHKLLEGDVLVFQLVRPCKFKVYIVRANDTSEIDGAVDASAVPISNDQTGRVMKICGDQKTRCLEPLPLKPYKKRVKDCDTEPLCANLKPIAELSDHHSDDSDKIDPEVTDGVRFSESKVQFKDIKGIQNFKILVDGLVIDSEIPPHLKVKYYELCRSQKGFLHDHLVEGLNCKLAAGIISETVNIADAIRASKLTSSRGNLTIWEETLKAFQNLGMNVGFLRDRLSRLVRIGFEREKVLECKRLERAQAEEKMRILEAKMREMKHVVKNVDQEIEGLKENEKMLKIKFEHEAKATW